MTQRWIENRATRGWRGIDLHELWEYREVALFLALRDLQVRYKQAVFGVGWALVQPLASVAVFTLVFRQFAGMSSDGVAYPLFAFAGMVLWSYVSGAVTRSTQSLISNTPLVTKIYFPRLLVPLAAVLPGLADLVVSLGLLALLLVAYGARPGFGVLTVPLWILAAISVSLGIGVWLAALNVRFRDVNHAVNLIVQLWLFLSPIAYPLSVVDATWRPLYALNPMVGIVEGFRWALLDTPWPGAPVLVSIVSGVLLLLLGVAYFQRSERGFADII